MNTHKANEASMKHEACIEARTSTSLIIVLHRCVCFTIAKLLLNKFFIVNVERSIRKTLCEMKKNLGSGENILSQLSMAEDRPAEAVRKYPVLYDKSDIFFKDKNKNYWPGGCYLGSTF